MRSEAAERADFHRLRYAQCWEDADILLEALDIRPGDVCLSIASAGDNALAMLSRHPERVVAVDLSPAQIACLELRVAAYRELGHGEMRELMGSLPSRRRAPLYLRCRSLLSPAARRFWDARPDEIAAGIGGAGKFERYLSLFRTCILPLVHPGSRIARLLQGGARERREVCYSREWDTWRWRLVFRIFFSRLILGRFGRDPAFFHYVKGSVANRLLERTHYALTALDPSDNPYLQWILTGRHLTALPYALRPENFATIRGHLDRLEWHCCSLEDFLNRVREDRFDRFNLSDVFEYMSPDASSRMLERLVSQGRSGGRLAYWNMLVPRSRPDHLADRLRPLPMLARRLSLEDKAFFYGAFIVEEIV